jgi:hypothetical protein
MRLVATNRASTDTGSVEGGELGMRLVAVNRASTDTGSVEGGELGMRLVATNRASTDTGRWREEPQQHYFGTLPEYSNFDDLSFFKL